jgi:hypothetical protein
MNFLEANPFADRDVGRLGKQFPFFNIYTNRRRSTKATAANANVVSSQSPRRHFFSWRIPTARRQVFAKHLFGFCSEMIAGGVL